MPCALQPHPASLHCLRLTASASLPVPSGLAPSDGLTYRYAVMRNFSWVLVAVPFLACCGGKGEHNAEEQEQPVEEPEALITDCTVENSEAECELYCHLDSGAPVTGECVLGAVPGELRCSCEGGPSDGVFFSLSSCDDLQATIASVCTQSLSIPACPSAVPAVGQSCSHRQTCWVEEFSGDCAPGEAVRSRSVGVECVDGVWRETGVGEESCP